MTPRRSAVLILDAAFVAVLVFSALALVIRTPQVPMEKSAYDEYDHRLASIKDVDTIIAVS